MRRFSLIALVFVVSLAVRASAQRPPDAVTIDPKVHNVLFENDHVRVFEARASMPVASPMHSHPPLVFIGMETARVKMGLADGKKAMFDVYPGQVFWAGDGLVHSWEMISGRLRVIAVEVKSAQRSPAGALPAVARKANDAVTADPDVHNVLFENDHVRVFDGRAAKGRKSPMHSHSPFVLVSLGTARMNLTLPNGSNAIFDTYPGQVVWMENAEHAWEILSGDVHVIAVEIKSALRAPRAKTE
jgi:hypothetical protein